MSYYHFLYRKSYAEIAREVDLNLHTVINLIKRWVEHGVLHLPGWGGSKPRVLPPGVTEWLISPSRLKEMAFLTIRERCDLLWKTHRVKLGPHGLTNLYKRHGIGYKRSRT